MSSKKYTDQKREVLSQNANVIKVGEINVKYSKKFKIWTIKEYKKGKTPIQTFNEAGIPVRISGKDGERHTKNLEKKVYLTKPGWWSTSN